MAVLFHQLHAADRVQRNRWYVFVRLVLLLIIGVPGILSLVIFQGWSEEVSRDAAILGIALLTNLLFRLLVRARPGNGQYQAVLGMVWIMLDLVLVTAVIFINGAIESRSAILYTVPILVAGALYGRFATYAAAIAGSVLYTLLIVADYIGIIPSVGAINPGLHNSLPYVVNAICFVPSVLLVIAMGADFMTKLLLKEERQAQVNLDALNRAQDIAKLGSWEWDVALDKISWSDGLLKVFGLLERPEVLKYDSYLQMIHPDDREIHSKRIQTALKKKTSFQTDHRIILQDGSVKYLHGEGRPEFDASGKVIRMSGTAQDVTDVRNLDLAKREFVSLASHQLRTPASGVKAFLSLLLDGYAGDVSSKQRKFIMKAHDANNRQLEIIDNLLNLAAIESGKMKLRKRPIDLNDLVKQCLPNHMHELKSRGQKLSTTYSPVACRVNADASHLLMAIDNLLSNAIKYTPDKGKITVTVTARKTAAYLIVTDTGIGIAPENVKALFEKFSRIQDPASSTVGGSGLGLYLAQYVVKLHRGTITVRSRHGEGTAFKIRLPLLP